MSLTKNLDPEDWSIFRPFGSFKPDFKGNKDLGKLFEFQIVMDVSKSSSSVVGSYDYDVFLSSGLDTRKDVADLLCRGLVDAGLRVFRCKELLLDGDELPMGEDVLPLGLQAIHRSRISIPIFSREYASSERCLQEVEQMLECRENRGHMIFPIYYDVGKCDVQNPTSSFGDLEGYERSAINPDRIESWKRALQEIASLKGWQVEQGYCFVENVKFIVNVILNKLKRNPRNVLVGMQDQAEKLKKLLDDESRDVLFVGIHGIGGIGKTALAKAVFDQLSTHFGGCSFLVDVRETSKHKGLKYLQDQLLGDINDADTDYGTKTICNNFLEKKVLIVLDDVDDREQIKTLVGKSNRFASGSRIIVTTRDINVLAVEHDTVDGRILEWPVEVWRFEMEEMKSGDALQLFCIHAFGNVHPPDDYQSTCSGVLSALGGHPLALEIVGSFLYRKPENVWKKTLEKLVQLRHEGLNGKLMISYEALDHETREVFLDIACFFTGGETTALSYVWDASEFLVEQRIEVLVFMSLIKVSGDNRLQMHDQVKDFGRQIACGGATADTAKGSRFWANKEVLDILRSTEENDNVQGLRLCYNDFPQNYTLPSGELGSLPNLRFLELSGFPFTMTRNLPKLRWLSWHFCPKHVEANDLYLEKLVILDLSSSCIDDELAGSGKLEMAKNLKVLNLTSCKRITKTPIFSGEMILESLILEDCEKLVKIDSSIGKLKRLTYLNLKGCNSLDELPSELGSAKALTEIVMKGSGQFFKLNESIPGLASLLVLEIDNVKIANTLNIGNLERLERLTLTKCTGIEKLPGSVRFFTSLVKLDLRGSEITHLPESIGEMKKLKVINMEFSLIYEFPKSIGNLEDLEEVHAKRCENLQGEIPSEIGRLTSLSFLDLSSTRISSLPSTMSQLVNLHTLNLESCHELEELPKLPRGLVSLHVMSMKLKNLPDLSEMNKLRDLQLVCRVDKVQADWIGKLFGLEKLELLIPRLTALKFGVTSQLRSLSLSCSEISTLPHLPSTLSRLCLAHLDKSTKFTSLCNLERLTSLELYRCSISGDQFRSLGVELKSLKRLSATKCSFSSVNGPRLFVWPKGKHGTLLPEGLRVLSMQECELPDEVIDLSRVKNLIHLELIDCQLLIEIRGFDKLESLEQISICHCDSLETFGDLSNLKSLEALQIDSCEKLREVKGLGSIKSLKHLEIYGCKSLKSSPTNVK